MRVVVDTNVLVSAILSPLGVPAQILDLVLSRRVTLLLTPLILKEYSDVLGRRELGFDEKAVKNLLRIIQLHAEQAVTTKTSHELPDPDDQVFLDCAAGGAADFLITGNKKHFPARLCHPVKVLLPAEFVQHMKGR